ncbi:MAG: transporter [Gemmatimonadales bacterium]
MLRRGVLCLVVCLMIATRLEAQGSSQDVPLRERIKELFTFGNCGKPLCLDVVGVHGDHFIPASQTGAFSVISFLTDAIGVNASNFPVSATSSGATFKFVGGLPVKTSESSGPVFGERAQTLGRGRFLMGANLSGIRFKSLRGVPIDNLTLNFTHQDIAPIDTLGQPAFENDIIAVRMSLFVDVFVSSFFVTYGLLDKVDLGVAVPIVHTSLQGRSTGQIQPFGTPVLHFFSGTSADPVLRAAAATFGSATGIGDIATRLKVNLHSGDHFSVALLADARLPTGDEKQLLGSGKLSLRGLMIFSGRYGEFSPHLNLGYLYKEGNLSNDQILATAGFDQLLNSWATIAGEVLSEWEVGNNKLVLPGPVTYQFPFVRTVEPTSIPNQHDNRINSSLGFKFRTGGGPTLVTNVLVPLLRGGLEPDVVWTTGVEFNF